MTRTSFQETFGTERPSGAADPITPSPPPRAFERALTLAAMGFHEEAIKVLRDVTARAPDHAPAWKRLAELLCLAGEDKEAGDARSRASGGSAAWPTALDSRTPEDIGAAENALWDRVRNLETTHEQLKSMRDHLIGHETDVAAMRLLAALERQGGDLMTARTLLERALDLAPDCDDARAEFADLLQMLDENKRAVAESSLLVAHAPANFQYRALHANGLCALGDFDSAIPLIEQVMRADPTDVRVRRVYAAILYAAGRREDSAREYRACLAMEPGMAAAYGGLAELRGDWFMAEDIAAMRERLRNGDVDPVSRRTLQYALGQALEETRDFSASFAAYESAVALSQAIAVDNGNVYRPEKEADQLARRRAVFSAPLLARGAPGETPAHTPIFVVGMPRAGSTLVEQILASHSLVEGTMELPVLGNIVRDLALSRLISKPDAYPERASELTASELADLGAHYLDEAAAYRRTNRPYFVDKRPWNWLDAGLIRLILPHAKIIDVRRQPMAACFAMYKHQVAVDTEVPYGFADLARCYAQYVGMMAYYEKVMPGHIHFLSYERLVEDTESEVRRLLDYCGLPFEEGCLRFWETSRPVATPSGEQVRHPISREALEQWRNFEPWLGPLKQALTEAEILAAALPQAPAYEKALSLVAMGMVDAAIQELRTVTATAPSHYWAWNKLAELLRWAGEDREADDALATAARCTGEASRWQPTRDTRTAAQLKADMRALQAQYARLGRLEQIEALRDLLQENPIDSVAAHMLSRLEWKDGDKATALRLIKRALELSPFADDCRAELASMLIQQGDHLGGVEQTTALLRHAPGNAEYRATHAEALRMLGDIEAALPVTEGLLREQPRNARLWFTHGMLLHSVGRRDDSARAFRTCLDISPGLGRGYWGLAYLKGRFLTDSDVAAMRECLADPGMGPDSRMYMYYALGYALERAGNFSASFDAYQRGARLFRGFFLGHAEAYSEEAFVGQVRAYKKAFSAANIARLAIPPSPSPAVTPIFIVGLPRAGSTLTEQILASHSQVEGTRELPLMGNIIRELVHSRRATTPHPYPDCVPDLAPSRLAALGERFIEAARHYRKTDRPWFIDKRPWNWQEAGLIHLIMPHAKIIDIRREPMAACFGIFKHVLTDGGDFSFELHNLGRYYTEYAGLMEHWKSVMPGVVHFVQYERLVEDTETEIRRMLEYCGLPFEEGCLRFWETDRAIISPSAEQVRRPIFRDAVEQWRNFEPWLGSLKEALSEPPRA